MPITNLNDLFDETIEDDDNEKKSSNKNNKQNVNPMNGIPGNIFNGLSQDKMDEIQNIASKNQQLMMKLLPYIDLAEFMQMMASNPTEEDLEEFVAKLTEKIPTDIMDEINKMGEDVASILGDMGNKNSNITDEEQAEIEELERIMNEGCNGDCDEDECSCRSNSTDNNKEAEEKKPTTEAFERLLNRRVPLFSIYCQKFSKGQFVREFDIEDEIDEDTIPSIKFSSILPQEWIDSFKEVSLARYQIDNQDNKVIFGFMVPDYKNSKADVSVEVIPPFFGIYKTEAGDFALHICQDKNLVLDDGSLVMFGDVFTPEFLEDGKKQVADMLSQKNAGTNGISFISVEDPSDDEVNLNLKMSLYSNILQAIGFDESRLHDYFETKFFVDKTPWLSINELGTVVPITEYKTIDSGYIYIGEIDLNDNQDVDDFIRSYDIKPHGNAVDFYIKMETKTIPDRLVKSFRETANTLLESDNFLNHMEVDASSKNNIVFVDITKI